MLVGEIHPSPSERNLHSSPGEARNGDSKRSEECPLLDLLAAFACARLEVKELIS